MKFLLLNIFFIGTIFAQQDSTPSDISVKVKHIPKVQVIIPSTITVLPTIVEGNLPVLLTLSQLDPTKLAAIIAPVDSPKQPIKVIDTTIESLCNQLIASGSSITTLNRLQVTLNVIGKDQFVKWLNMRDILFDTDAYPGNWLGISIIKLRSRIEKEGCSAGVLADYNDIKKQIFANK